MHINNMKHLFMTWTEQCLKCFAALEFPFCMAYLFLPVFQLNSNCLCIYVLFMF